MHKYRIAIIGAGTIGRTHIETALKNAAVEIVGVAEPSDGGKAWVQSHQVPWFAHHSDLLSATKPDGVIIATPNDAHANVALDCLNHDVAVLVEKPIADTLENARSICEAALAKGLPALVGHHRRHNPIMRQAKSIVESGVLGKPVSMTAMCTWYKDDDYFKAQWRRQSGGGPVLINLIHDIDLLRFLYGDIASVQAMTSNAVRGFEVEDTAVVLMRFVNGALGTVTVSDTTVSPWNYDLAARETDRFPQQDINSHFFSGTHGSLTLPKLEVWSYQDQRHWEKPISVTRTEPMRTSPYEAQLNNFLAVIAGKEKPICAAQDGLRALEAALAVRESATSGIAVQLPTC
jgi:predicted dehydrogenase